jgi:hypothetical protein
MGRQQRFVLLGLAVLVAVVAAIVAGTGGDDDDGVIDTRTQTTPSTATPPTATTTTAPAGTTAAEPVQADPTIVVRDGQPVGGVRRLRFRKGGDIVFVVRSDTAGEIHLHGYDIAKDVKAGGSVRFDVPAKIDGRFEVEIEETATPIAEIEVVP